MVSKLVGIFGFFAVVQQKAIALDPYPTCADDYACDPACSKLCRDRAEASDTSPNCWGTENWMCGPYNPEETRNQPSCTYAWYSTGEVWGADQFSIIDAENVKVFCTNVCPDGYFMLSSNLEDDELPYLSPEDLQEIIISDNNRRLLQKNSDTEGGGTDSSILVDRVEELEASALEMEQLRLDFISNTVNLAREKLEIVARSLSNKDTLCDLETVNECSQTYLGYSTVEMLTDCQTLWDYYYCIFDLECDYTYDETLADIMVLVDNAGCANFTYQPRDDCSEEDASICIDALDSGLCTSISEFRVCMQNIGCVTEDDYDSDFEEIMESLDDLDDLCEFECRNCDEGCRSTLWCLDYYGCAKCNSSASLWIDDGYPFICLSTCPSGYASQAGTCIQCIGVVEDQTCIEISGTAHSECDYWIYAIAISLVVFLQGNDAWW